ncbi:MAG: ABC transporter ATP-binding protein [Lachnospiraceae bacterium]|nr:ABC transporter ATP-binding protein [Lachnospiraceae bacterium]
MEDKILDVKNLRISFANGNTEKVVVNGINFSVGRGEIVGVVGESGSGKSMTALAITGLITHEANVSGEILLNGKDVTKYKREDWCKVRGNEICVVFQEPMTALNPVMKIGRQVGETLHLHRGMKEEDVKPRVFKMLRLVELDNVEELYERYPHELSGGQRQRVMIAMALINKPDLIIADEPTTALDVTTQREVLHLFKRIHDETNTSVLFISHDLNVIKEICSRTLVMYKGNIVEQGDTMEVMEHPKEEYTKTLVSAVPINDSKIEEKESILKVRNLNVFYTQRKTHLQILKNISFDLYKGEILGLVGESGSGKSTLARAITGLNPDYQGTIDFGSVRPQMVFQDPYSSLNPAHRIGWILEEPLRIAGIKDKAERRKRVESVLDEVGIGADHYNRFPSELSGGQRQRIAIGAAIIAGSRFIIADEPVSALDVTVSSQILKLLLKLHDEMKLSILFISHDLDMVRKFCNRVMVLYQGEIVEMGSTEEVYRDPKHEYTKHLLYGEGEGLGKHIGEKVYE